MKKKYFVISAIVCAIGLTAIFATKASAGCSFSDENKNIYMCAADYVTCQSAPIGCEGIKILALPGHPTGF